MLVYHQKKERKSLAWHLVSQTCMRLSKIFSTEGRPQANFVLILTYSRMFDCIHRAYGFRCKLDLIKSISSWCTFSLFSQEQHFHILQAMTKIKQQPTPVYIHSSSSPVRNMDSARNPLIFPIMRKRPSAFSFVMNLWTLLAGWPLFHGKNIPLEPSGALFWSRCPASIHYTSIATEV